MVERTNNCLVKNILSDSIADEAGISKGDCIIRINNNIIGDYIDYKNLIADEFLKVLVKTQKGEYIEIEIQKDYDEDLGIEFEKPLLDDQIECQNNCIFCFVNQMPPKMRKSLYIKDDDYRTSFFQGNFITLTNLREKDIKRIIKYKLSPLYISIHSTNPEVRIKMMNNKKAGNIYNILEKLINNNIKIHGQVVLCPGINDGLELDKTIKDLSKLWPGLISIAVVPVGLTKFRDNLTNIKGFNKDDSRKIVKSIERWQEHFRKKFNYSFVFASDEFYLNSKIVIPGPKYYEDYPQIENGVGLVSLFLESKKNTKLNTKILEYNKEVSVVTGVLSYPIIEDVLYPLKQIKNLKLNVHSLTNTFFGENITVVGLLTGQDLINQLRDRRLGEKIIIPDSMLKRDDRILLDDISIDTIEKELNLKVEISKIDVKDLISKILK